MKTYKKILMAGLAALVLSTASCSITTIANTENNNQYNSYSCTKYGYDSMWSHTVGDISAINGKKEAKFSGNNIRFNNGYNSIRYKNMSGQEALDAINACTKALDNLPKEKQ
ncbi:MAG: hypothetical protein WC413_00775 [Candidatus Nanoarchaeia archaeon]